MTLIVGTAENDNLVGDADFEGQPLPNADTIRGLDGDDTLSGRTGPDSLDGGAGNDSLFGGSGEDRLDGGADNDVLQGGSDNDTLDGGTGINQLQGDAGADIFAISIGGDNTLTDFSIAEGDRIDVSAMGISNFTSLLDMISATPTGTQLLFTGPGAITRVTFGTESELLSESNFIFWTDPNELIVGDDATADNLSGGAGNDTLQGFGGNDTLDGGADNDSLLGGGGDDSLIGGAGNDTLDGGPGRNSLTGGTGADVFAVSLGGITTITDFSIADGDKLDLSALGISDLETFYALAEDPFGRTFLSVTTIGGVRTQVIVHGINESDLGNHLLFSSDATDDLITTTSTLSETLIGGLGNDTLQAAGATHSLFGEDGNDLITLMNGSVFARGGAGADTFRVEGIEGDSYLRIDDFSSFEGDRIDVSALGILDFAAVLANGTMDGKSATITFTISGATHTIVLTDVRLSDLTASDFIFAPPIGKLFSGTNAADNVVGDVGNDTLLGRGGDDTMDGAAGNDSLDGGAGNDSLIGGAGDDWLRGGIGQDWLEGGTGDDRFYVDDAGDLIIEVADGGTADRVFASTHYMLGSGVQVEYLSTNLASGTNQIDLTGNELDQIITGNAGASTLRGLGGDDVIYGLDGNDLLDGGSGSDTLYGGSEADILMGGADADRMIGGLGNDSYFVDSVGDRVIEFADAGWDTVIVSGLTGFTLLASQSIEMVQVADVEGTSAMNLTGNDLSQTLSANNGANILRGLGGDDELVGLGGNDTLVGGAGNDILNGGTGSNRLVGGLGNDTYVIDSRTDVISEAAGQGTDAVLVIDTLSSFTLSSWHEIESISAADQAGTAAMTLVGNSLSQAITGNAGANILRGLDGDDNLSGLGGNDQLFGGDGNDNLFGGDGSDRLTGGTGNDYIVAGAGADTLVGGAGADTFVFDSAIGGTEIDRITDFSAGEDVISLTSFIFSQIESGFLTAESFEVNESGVATNGATRIVYESDTGRLIYDMDGTGDTAGVHFATLNANLVGLSATDFLIL